jgi:hypothetical protein
MLVVGGKIFHMRWKFAIKKKNHFTTWVEGKIEWNGKFFPQIEINSFLSIDICEEVRKMKCHESNFSGNKFLELKNSSSCYGDTFWDFWSEVVTKNTTYVRCLGDETRMWKHERLTRVRNLSLKLILKNVKIFKIFWKFFNIL